MGTTVRTLLTALATVALVSPVFAQGVFAQGKGEIATAQLKTRDGKAAGEVTLHQTPNGVLIRASFDGLPAGEHAIHLHEKGSCQPPDFESAGGHFAPDGRRHGFKDQKGAHAGDLPNVDIPESGTASVEMFTSRVTLRSGKASLLDRDGAAVVVHARPDDYTTDPAGNAGDRIACGEIKG